MGAESTGRNGVVHVAATLGKASKIDGCKTVKTGWVPTLLHQAEVAKPGQRRWVCSYHMVVFLHSSSTRFLHQENLATDMTFLDSIECAYIHLASLQ